ncbi:TPA: hypothetical protein L5C56_006367 [Pseudomonas aeruginosa]|nr:hypothetical protein [Pseudomonas aeruginosa]
MRTFESGWIPPSAAEVLAVMRLASLEPRDAAVVLGGLSRREVNRWTTGQDEIPYAYWVLLCQRAKLAYREQPAAQSSNVYHDPAVIQAYFTGILAGQVRRNGWTEAEAARQMKTSEANVRHLLALEVQSVPLEDLLEMAFACGIWLELKFIIPGSQDGSHEE